MDEISNKTLAILLIGAIVISLGGTLISLNRLTRIKIPMITGFDVTDTATVDLIISALAEVNFTTDNINWGTGTVNATKTSCMMNSWDTARGVNCTGFTPNTAGLVLENIGNRNVTLALHTGKTAANFIGGTNPGYHFNVSDLEGGSCGTNSWAVTQGALTAAAITNISICNSSGGGFLADNSKDTLNIDVRVVIPDDTVGAKTDTITAEIAQI